MFDVLNQSQPHFKRIVALKVVRYPRTAQPSCRCQLRVLISVASGSLSYLRKVALPYTKHHGEKD